MELTVQFIGFQTIYERVREPLNINLPDGLGLLDLVHALIARHGEWMRKALWDPHLNCLDPVAQIQVNGHLLDRSDIDHVCLNDGDRVTFMQLIAGG